MIQRCHLFCVLVCIVLYLPDSSAVTSLCDKNNGTDAVGCSLDGFSIAHCNVNIMRRNKTKEQFCSTVSDGARLSAENAENFEFAVAAYERSFNFPGYTLPGANVSVVVRSKDTTGFVLWLHVKNYDRCRYIDIANVSEFAHSLTIWDDCSFFKADEIGYQFTVTVTEMPSKLQRQLSCKVPDRNNLYPETITEWKSMICVELVFSETPIAQGWFQTTPRKFGNHSYSLKLYQDDVMVENRTVYASGSLHQSLESWKFSHLKAGNYTVEVTSLHPDGDSRCLTATSWPFQIRLYDPSPEGLSVFLACLIGLGVLVLVVTVILVLFISRMKTLPTGSSLYLVYAYERKLHFNLVQQFAVMLKALGFKVRFDAWEVQNIDPLDWSFQCVGDADFIVIVWSPAAVRRFQAYRDAAKPKKDQKRNFCANTAESDELKEPWFRASHLFVPTLNYVSNRINNSCHTDGKHKPNSVCNICWDSSMKSQIPVKFRYLPTFVMPKKLSKFVQYLCYFRQSPVPMHYKLPCDPCLQGESLKKCSEHGPFLKCLNDYKSDPLHGDRELNDFDNERNEILERDSPIVSDSKDGDADGCLIDLGYCSLSTEGAQPSIQNEPRLLFAGTVNEPLVESPNIGCDSDSADVDFVHSILDQPDA